MNARSSIDMAVSTSGMHSTVSMASVTCRGLPEVSQSFSMQCRVFCRGVVVVLRSCGGGGVVSLRSSLCEILDPQKNLAGHPAKAAPKPTAHLKQQSSTITLDTSTNLFPVKTWTVRDFPNSARSSRQCLSQRRIERRSTSTSSRRAYLCKLH